MHLQCLSHQQHQSSSCCSSNCNHTRTSQVSFQDKFSWTLVQGIHWQKPLTRHASPRYEFASILHSKSPFFRVSPRLRVRITNNNFNLNLLSTNSTLLFVVPFPLPSFHFAHLPLGWFPGTCPATDSLRDSQCPVSLGPGVDMTRHLTSLRFSLTAG